MPRFPSPDQIRGARGMLDWSMLDLATAASLSVSTVKRIESGGPQPVSEAAHGALRDALEAAGIRFLDDAGEGAGLRLQVRSDAPSASQETEDG